MFCVHFEKGPLSQTWLAAHWDRKLTRAHILESDVERIVEAILAPQQLSLNLRISSHLLLGVVRIYSRKAKYLLADCNDALVKIKLAFRPCVVDVPAENRDASLRATSIHEDFIGFDVNIRNFNVIDFHARIAVNQSRPEEITLREEIPCMPYVGDDSFVVNDSLGGPITMEELDSLLERLSTRIPAHSVDINGELLQKADVELNTLRTPQRMIRHASVADSGFGSPSIWLSEVTGTGITSRFLDSDCGKCKRTAATLVDITNPTSSSGVSLPSTATMCGSHSMLMLGDFDFNPGADANPEVVLDDILLDQNAEEVEVLPMQLLREKEILHGEDELDNTRVGTEEVDNDDCTGNYSGAWEDDDSLNDYFGGAADLKLFCEDGVQKQKGRLLCEEQTAVMPPPAKTSVSTNVMEESGAFCEEPCTNLVQSPRCQTTIQNLTTPKEYGTGAFSLGSIEVTIKEHKAKQKRRLISDEQKVISSETMKTSLLDSSSNIVLPFDFAPPTVKLMLWKANGGVDRLFILPGKPIISKKLLEQFTRNLVTSCVFNDDSEVTYMTAGADELRLGDGCKIEVMCGEVITDGKQDMSQQSLVAYDVSDRKISLQVRGSPQLECSNFPVNESTSNMNGETVTHQDDIVDPELNISSCLDHLLSLPVNDSTLSTDPVAREEGSPSQNQCVQSHSSRSPSVQLVESFHQPSNSSDFEEDADNEDAISDVDLAMTSNEGASLCQELEEDGLEEDLWNQRSTQMQNILRRKLETSPTTSFRQLSVRNNRKQVASKFYAILFLIKVRAVMVEQKEPYGDIQITRGPAFTDSV